MQNLQALLVGENVELMIAVPTLLSRAGFVVDVITNSYIFKKHPVIRNFVFVANPDDIARVAFEKNNNNYSLIVIGDDNTLKKILITFIPKLDFQKYSENLELIRPNSKSQKINLN